MSPLSPATKPLWAHAYNIFSLAFDETASYTSTNDVFSVLLGDAVPTSAHGTTDGTAYNHYSILATVENNWDLGDLGENDAGAATFF